MPNRTDLPVVVVGAGPVGMTAAAALVRADVPVVVVEAAPRPSPDWRASTFHAATLELLEDIEITERMHDEGLVVPRYQFRDRAEGLVAEFDLGLLADETRYPYRLQLNQQHLVRFLYERLLDDEQAELLFGCRFVAAEPTADGVEVTVATPGGDTRIRASHLIGADGPRSSVRRSLGISFEGHTYTERFLIVSTPVDMREQLPGIAEVNYVADPEEWLFILRTPESWRVLWPVPAEVAAEQATRPEVMQARLQGVAPRAEEYPIIDHQIYSVHQRVAGTFRKGDAFLIGDAAHINSPIGGVGLNSGIHDAMDLTRGSYGSGPAPPRPPPSWTPSPNAAGASRWSTCRPTPNATPSGCANGTRRSAGGTRPSWPRSPPTRPVPAPGCAASHCWKACGGSASVCPRPSCTIGSP